MTPSDLDDNSPASPGGMPPHQAPPPRPSTSQNQPRPETTPPGAKSQSWSAQAADLVVEWIDTLRRATTDRALTIVRALVYGTAIIIVAVVAIVLFVILAIRIVDVYLPGNVWSTYLLFGLVFLTLGLILWGKRKENLPGAA